MLLQVEGRYAVWWSFNTRCAPQLELLNMDLWLIVMKTINRYTNTPTVLVIELVLQRTDQTNSALFEPIGPKVSLNNMLSVNCNIRLHFVMI